MRGFSQQVRSHLAQLEPGKSCCRQAQLLALLSVTASETASGKLVLAVENGGVARLLFKLIKAAFGPTPRLDDPEAGRGHYRLVMDLPSEEEAAAMSLGQLRTALRRRRCCRRAFLRGAFLGCGSLVDPERAYHLEFTAPEHVATWIGSLLEAESIHTGRYQRQGHVPHTVYVKRSEDIAAFLTIVEAVPALLALEEVLITRDLKNHVQRTVNCETANLDRTVRTAQHQILQIEELRLRGLLDQASEGLRETARLRLEHPYLSLAGLAELHQPPLSKSAINHRLRKLAELASGRPEGDSPAVSAGIRLASGPEAGVRAGSR